MSPRPAPRSSVSLLRDALHALFADLLPPTTRGRQGLAVDVVDGPRWVEVQVDLLPLASDDLEVQVEGDVLRIVGSRVVEVDESDAKDRLRVRKRWHFRRGVHLPKDLDPRSARVRYEGGLLTVALAKRG